MSSYPITYPVTRPVTYAPSNAVLGGALAPPSGFVFLVDSDGYYLIDSDGYYLLDKA